MNRELTAYSREQSTEQSNEMHGNPQINNNKSNDTIISSEKATHTHKSSNSKTQIDPLDMPA